MKRNELNREEILPEYDFSQGVRGKYSKRYEKGSNVVVLSPEVAAAFPNAEAVNNALRTLLSTGTLLAKIVREIASELPPKGIPA